MSRGPDPSLRRDGGGSRRGPDPSLGSSTGRRGGRPAVPRVSPRRVDAPQPPDQIAKAAAKAGLTAEETAQVVEAVRADPSLKQRALDGLAVMAAEKAPAAGGPRTGAAGQPAVPISGELTGVANDLGITFAPGGAVDAEDPPVYWATRDSKGRQRRAKPYILMSEALVAPAKWKDEDLEAFQRRMFAAGMYGSMKEAEIPFGTFDTYTQQAWSQLVKTSQVYTAAGQKITPQDVLGRLPAVGPAAGPADAPLVATVSNPDDLRAVFKKAARESLGTGNIDPKKIDQMVAAYQAAEQAPQEQADALGNASGGTVAGAPNAASFADDAFKEYDPERYDAQKVVGGLRQVFDMFGGQ